MGLADTYNPNYGGRALTDPETTFLKKLDRAGLSTSDNIESEWVYLRSRGTATLKLKTISKASTLGPSEHIAIEFRQKPVKEIIMTLATFHPRDANELLTRTLLEAKEELGTSFTAHNLSRYIILKDQAWRSDPVRKKNRHIGLRIAELPSNPKPGNDTPVFEDASTSNPVSYTVQDLAAFASANMGMDVLLAGIYTNQYPERILEMRELPYDWVEGFFRPKRPEGSTD